MPEPDGPSNCRASRMRTQSSCLPNQMELTTGTRWRFTRLPDWSTSRREWALRWCTFPTRSGNMIRIGTTWGSTAIMKDRFSRKPTGELVAWDPVAQKAVWRAKYPVLDGGGVLATGGNLVFQGRADGIFAAFRATDG